MEISLQSSHPKRGSSLILAPSNLLGVLAREINTMKSEDLDMELSILYRDYGNTSNQEEDRVRKILEAQGA